MITLPEEYHVVAVILEESSKWEAKSEWNFVLFYVDQGSATPLG